MLLLPLSSASPTLNPGRPSWRSVAAPTSSIHRDGLIRSDHSTSHGHSVSLVLCCVLRYWIVSDFTGMVAAAREQAKKRGASRSLILFDAAGEERVLDADKYAIMHRVDINARDLRILDQLLSYPSTILGRERAIVLNLEHIKAIITSEEVLLRDLSDENVIPVVEELRRRLAPSNATQHDGKENLSGQNDVEGAEEDGVLNIERRFEARVYHLLWPLGDLRYSLGLSLPLSNSNVHGLFDNKDNVGDMYMLSSVLPLCMVLQFLLQQ